MKWMKNWSHSRRGWDVVGEKEERGYCWKGWYHKASYNWGQGQSRPPSHCRPITSFLVGLIFYMIDQFLWISWLTFYFLYILWSLRNWEDLVGLLSLKKWQQSEWLITLNYIKNNSAHWANQPTDCRAKYQRPLNRTQRTVLLKFRQNSLIKTLRFGCHLY